jgi:hypothetical protein
MCDELSGQQHEILPNEHVNQCIISSGSQKPTRSEADNERGPQAEDEDEDG